MRPSVTLFAPSTLAKQIQSHALATKDATFRLPPGRLLGYAEYGNPQGLPLFVFHGYPSSRLETGPLDATGRRLGFRLISLDRPGFGLSTPHPKRTMLDWTRDVDHFAEGMGIRRFAVAGFSGGGPYALACAHALERDKVGAVGLFASGPPWEAGLRFVSRPRRVLRYMAVNYPDVLRLSLDACMGVLRWTSRRQYVIRKTEEWLAAQDGKKVSGEVVDIGNEATETDGHQERKPLSQRRQELFQILDEPFAQGAAAAVEEAELLSNQSWGFRLEDVEYNLVRIWHGVEDANASIEMIRYLARKVPHGVLTEYEGMTHYMVYPKIGGALEELLEDFKRMA